MVIHRKSEQLQYESPEEEVQPQQDPAVAAPSPALETSVEKPAKEGTRHSQQKPVEQVETPDPKVEQHKQSSAEEESLPQKVPSMPSTSTSDATNGHTTKEAPKPLLLTYLHLKDPKTKEDLLDDVVSLAGTDEEIGTQPITDDVQQLHSPEAAEDDQDMTLLLGVMEAK